MEEALTAIVLEDPGVVSAVGQRVHWGVRPQGSALPAIVFNRITGIRDYHMQGASGFVESRIQGDCYGATYTAAKEAARALIALLSGYRGIQDDIEFKGAFIDSERDLTEIDGAAPENHHRVSVDFFIKHSE